MNILSLENVSKSYGTRMLFDQISFHMDEYDKVGLIGINGTGKSTLLNVMAGTDVPDFGNIIIPRGITIEYLPQNPSLDLQATILEQVFKGDSPVLQLIRTYQSTLDIASGNPNDKTLQSKLLQLSSDMTSINAWDLESQVKTVLSRLGIRNFNDRIGNLSGGQRKRVALASALITPCDLLLLDEPTNHLDLDAIDWLEKYLQRRKGALLMTTHDRYFLDRVVNKTIELDQGKMYVYSGNYEYYLEKKMERKALEIAVEEKRQNLYRKELEWMRRGARARSTKQKARIQRFEELQRAEHPVQEEKLDISVGHSRLGKKVIEIEDISIRFAGLELIKDFSYLLIRDDRVGVIGANGAGKSTLLKILSGYLQPDSGNVHIGSTVKIAFLSQESDDIPGELRAIEYIKDAAEFIRTADGFSISARQMMENFLFPSELQWTPIARLSGGEKRRLYLLRKLMDAPNVLLLDEPTNDLDIDTLQVLENYIDEFNGAVIAVSHDRCFLDRTCQKIFSFEGEGIILEHTGNYTEFMNHKTENPVSGQENAQPVEKPREGRTKTPRLRFTYHEQKEYDQIDADIEELVKQITDLEIEMEKAKSDYIQLEKLVTQKDQLEDQLLYKMERQEYLSDLEKQIQKSRM